MKTTIYVLTIIFILALLVFLFPRTTKAPIPVRQSQEIRAQSNSNDQQAVQAIEENIPASQE